jgi:hypothetical protein
MLNVFLICAAIGGPAAIFWCIVGLARRNQSLERELQRISGAMSQMAELQMKVHQRNTARISDLEERIMELSVPSHDSSLPLERRHQVLALARQGVNTQDIAKRLKAPLGETELILNLRKYMGGESSPAGKTQKQVRQYA